VPVHPDSGDATDVTLQKRAKLGIQRVQALADISRSAPFCHSNETRTPTASTPNSAHPTIPPSYIRVRAVVWECDKGQTHRHTDGRDRDTFHVGYVRLARNVTSSEATYLTCPPAQP